MISNFSKRAEILDVESALLTNSLAEEYFKWRPALNLQLIQQKTLIDTYVENKVKHQDEAVGDTKGIVV